MDITTGNNLLMRVVNAESLRHHYVKQGLTVLPYLALPLLPGIADSGMDLPIFSSPPGDDRQHTTTVHEGYLSLVIQSSLALALRHEVCESNALPYYDEDLAIPIAKLNGFKPFEIAPYDGTLTLEVVNMNIDMTGEKQTFGQKAVGLGFNPGGDDEVHRCKLILAEAIDQMHELRCASTDNQIKRMASEAITNIQTGQMWAVKALTWK